MSNTFRRQKNYYDDDDHGYKSGRKKQTERARQHTKDSRKQRQKRQVEEPSTHDEER